MFYRRDPGPCPVDDTPHTACCTPTSGPITIVQLPARDGYVPPPLVGGLSAPAAAELTPPPLVAELTQARLPAGQVTTGTYRTRRARR